MAELQIFWLSMGYHDTAEINVTSAAAFGSLYSVKVQAETSIWTGYTGSISKWLAVINVSLDL